MRLVLCSPCRPHGCVFPAEDVNERRQAIPEGTTTTLYQLRVAHEVKQTRPLAFLLEIVRRRESAPTRSKHVPGVLASSHETDRRTKRRIYYVRVHPIHLQIACWAPRGRGDAGLRGPQR